MKLEWQDMPPSYGKAVFADTPAGRWVVRQTISRRNRHYQLKLNGKLIERHETWKAAKADAEKRAERIKP